MLQAWTEELEESGRARAGVSIDDPRTQAGGFLGALSVATRHSTDGELAGRERDDVRAVLANVSRDRALAGFTPAAAVRLSSRDGTVGYGQRTPRESIHAGDPSRRCAALAIVKSDGKRRSPDQNAVPAAACPTPWRRASP